MVDMFNKKEIATLIDLGFPHNGRGEIEPHNTLFSYDTVRIQSTSLVVTKSRRTIQFSFPLPGLGVAANPCLVLEAKLLKLEDWAWYSFLLDFIAKAQEEILHNRSVAGLISSYVEPFLNVMEEDGIDFTLKASDYYWWILNPQMEFNQGESFLSKVIAKVTTDSITFEDGSTLGMEGALWMRCPKGTRLTLNDFTQTEIVLSGGEDPKAHVVKLSPWKERSISFSDILLVDFNPKPAISKISKVVI